MKLHFSIRDLLARGRRQFSVLLLLLVVALFAAIFGWLRAAREVHRWEETRRMEEQLHEWEVYGVPYGEDTETLRRKLRETKPAK